MGRSLLGTLLVVVLVLPLPAAGAAPSTSRVLVSFEDAIPSAIPGARILERFPFAQVALVEAPSGVLERAPGIAGIYPEERIELAMERERGIVNGDPPSGASWPSGEGVTVAIVDSGIDPSHPALASRVVASVRISKGGAVSGEAADSDGHGTHVAGIVGGDGTGSVDARHRGLAPGANLVGVDISDSFTTVNAVRAFAWIHENAERYDIRVVSNSWGREKEGGAYDSDDPVIRASDALVESGIVVVFSAGNRGRDGEATLTPEAMNPNVISVGAASGAGRVEGYSSRGPAVDTQERRVPWVKPDVVAPGTAVVSTRASVLAAPDARTDEERYYTTMNGTSMAAPQVAAAAALLLASQPKLAPADVQRLLQQSAADLGAPGADDATGYGMLDVAAALREAAFASGGERRIVVEKRVPVRVEGSLAAALGQVLVANNAPYLPPAATVTLPLQLREGAAAVDLWFNWTGQGGFDARLVGPEGGVAFERIGGNSLRLEAAAPPGSYRVEATPLGAASQASFVLAGAIIVREEQVVEVAAESHGRPVRSNSAFVADAPGGKLLALDPLMRAPLLVFAILATGAATYALARRKRAA